MKAVLASPAVKAFATAIASVFAASPMIPALAPYAALLTPIGSFILGAYHVTIPAKVKP